jgi:hypothetical protein
MQMPQGLAAQHSSELFPEDLSGEQFPLSQNRRMPALFGVRLSSSSKPRLNCSRRREFLKLVSPTPSFSQLGEKPGRTEALTLSRIGKQLSQHQCRCAFGWAVFESAGFPKRSAIFDQPLPKHEHGHESR